MQREILISSFHESLAKANGVAGYHAGISAERPQTDDIVALSRTIEMEVLALLDSRHGQELAASGRPAVCIDRGCGAGPNSRKLTGSFGRTIQQATTLPIMTFCNERYPRSFEQLAALHQTSLGTSWCRGLLCGSFLDQLLPSHSVMLATSNAALHWIDLRHPSLGMHGHIKPDSASLKALAASQWQHCVSSIAAELITGGKLVVSFVAAAPESNQPHVPLHLLDLAIRMVVGKYSEHDDSQLRFPVPIYLRSRREIAAPFLDLAVPSSQLVLDQLRVEAMPCPYFDRYVANGDSEAYARHFTSFIRAFSEASLRDWLQRFNPATCAEVTLDKIYTHIFRLVADDPWLWKMSKHRATLVATRR